jgi:glycogen debranching enzyme
MARKRETYGLSLKGSDVVFVGTERGVIGGPSRRGPGLYAWDTRHLSRYEFRPRAGRMTLRSAELVPDGARLRYGFRRGVTIERRLHVGSSVVDEWAISNAGASTASFEVDLLVDADFRDLFEVRRIRRRTLGRLLSPTATGHMVRLGYTAVDGVQHSTEIVAPSASWRITPKDVRARLKIKVAPGATSSLGVAVNVRSTLPRFDAAPRDWPDWERTSTRFASDSPDLDAWLAQSSSDLFLLCDRTADGYFPSAGIPWFVAPFGRDSIMTALFALPLRRDLAPAVLRKLASYQGKADVPARDEEPGRISHEVRRGEIVRTGGGFGTPYYGSVDATPLFVWMAAEAARWWPERDLIGEFEPSIRAALTWMDERGDLDGDGFIEFERRSPNGIVNQMWKDSGDSLLDAQGKRPAGPIAAVEIQAYAWAAWRSLAEVVAARDPAWAASLMGRADAMRARFEKAFWVAPRSFYAQALDGQKHQVRDVVSNPGHVLWAGIASDTHGRATARRLRQPDLASGWGIRTRSSRSIHYKPLSYQNGSVWPHDTAIAAAGMRRYGDRAGAARTIAEMIDSSRVFRDRRIPQLFGGQPRHDDDQPARYPVACVPIAWSAGAPFLCVRTMLGLEVSPDGRTVTIDPILPDGVNMFEARGLRVGTGSMDVKLARDRGRVRATGVQASGISVVVR